MQDYDVTTNKHTHKQINTLHAVSEKDTDIQEIFLQVIQIKYFGGTGIQKQLS